MITKVERYEFYKKQLKKYKTKLEKIEYLEQIIFLLEMIDNWSEFDRVSYDAAMELLNELKGIKK